MDQTESLLENLNDARQAFRTENRRRRKVKDALLAADTESDDPEIRARLADERLPALRSAEQATIVAAEAARAAARAAKAAVSGLALVDLDDASWQRAASMKPFVADQVGDAGSLDDLDALLRACQLKDDPALLFAASHEVARRLDLDPPATSTMANAVTEGTVRARLAAVWGTIAEPVAAEVGLTADALDAEASKALRIIAKARSNRDEPGGFRIADGVQRVRVPGSPRFDAAGDEIDDAGLPED